MPAVLPALGLGFRVRRRFDNDDGVARSNLTDAVTVSGEQATGDECLGGGEHVMSTLTAGPRRLKQALAHPRQLIRQHVDIKV
nr:hypothetical protein [Mycobacteroides abscessus]